MVLDESLDGYEPIVRRTVSKYSTNPGVLEELSRVGRAAIREVVREKPHASLRYISHLTDRKVWMYARSLSSRVRDQETSTFSEPEGENSQEKKRVPNGFLDEPSNQEQIVLDFLSENGISDIRGMNPEDVYETDIRGVVSFTRMLKHGRGLRGLLKRHGDSTYSVFTTLFPEQMLPWTIMSKEPWRDYPFTVAMNATRWLFENYFELPIESIPSYASHGLFRAMRLSAMMKNKSIGVYSLFNWFDLAYPDRFSEEDFESHRRILVPKRRKLLLPDLISRSKIK